METKPNYHDSMRFIALTIKTPSTPDRLSGYPVSFRSFLSSLNTDR